MVTSCSIIHSLLRSAIGTIAPLLMLKFLLGTIFSISISEILPKPLQCEQAPFGELKEKLFGSGEA